MNETISLQEAADRLGVHYMTAYRYVRLGKLPAEKRGNTWHVDVADLDGLTEQKTKRGSSNWPDRLEQRLLAGDEPAAWSIVENALATGATAADVYTRGFGPALRSIGDKWERGEVGVADEHRASLITSRLIGRLSPRFTTRGRKRGTIIVGCAAGEQHSLGSTMLADLLRLDHFDVEDLGANTPPEAFAAAARGRSDLTAVGISAFDGTNDRNVRMTIEALKGVTDVPVFVGGSAIRDVSHARALGADGFAAKAESALELFRSAREP